MIYWSWFLHFYQPPTQFPEVTEKIARESYEKVLKIISYQTHGRLTVNISASLTEQLEALGFEKIIEGFRQLAEEGRVELVDSAAYHPLLPKIPKKEMERQIRLNGEINRKYFGQAWHPQGPACRQAGFFPPEMAYSKEVGEVVEKLGYQWIILDESAARQKLPLRTQNTIHQKKSSKMKVFIRNRQLSLAIAFSRVSNLRQLFQFFDAKGYNLDDDCYIITAMDAETFGHHQPKQLKFLEELLITHNSQPQTIKFVTISELINLFPQGKEIEAKVSTWSDGWERWDDPKNPIHRLQWELYELAVRVVGAGGNEFSHPDDGALRSGAALACGTNLPAGKAGNTPFRSSLGGTPPRAPIISGMSKIVTRRSLTARELLDRALHSDQFWWASFQTRYWQPQMVERGARMLRDVVTLGAVSPKKKKEAEKLYNEIMAKVGQT